jgi:hypothetical protein
MQKKSLRSFKNSFLAKIRRDGYPDQCPQEKEKNIFLELITIRVARIFGTTYQKGKNMPNDHEAYQIATKYTHLLYNRPNKWP